MCEQLDYITNQLNINMCATRLYYKPTEHKVAKYKTPLITSITMLESVQLWMKNQWHRDQRNGSSPTCARLARFNMNAPSKEQIADTEELHFLAIFLTNLHPRFLLLPSPS